MRGRRTVEGLYSAGNDCSCTISPSSAAVPIGSAPSLTLSPSPVPCRLVVLPIPSLFPPLDFTSRLPCALKWNRCKFGLLPGLMVIFFSPGFVSRNTSGADLAWAKLLDGSVASSVNDISASFPGGGAGEANRGEPGRPRADNSASSSFVCSSGALLSRERRSIPVFNEGEVPILYFRKDCKDRISGTRSVLSRSGRPIRTISSKLNFPGDVGDSSSNTIGTRLDLPIRVAD